MIWCYIKYIVHILAIEVYRRYIEEKIISVKFMKFVKSHDL